MTAKRRPLTRPQLERIVREWATRLKLDHWSIKIDWTKQPGDGEDACCARHEQYDDAKIRFSEDWAGWELVYANQTVVHELLHIVERDLSEAADSVRPLLSSQAWELYTQRMTHEREGVIDRLAVVLVELAGEVR